MHFDSVACYSNSYGFMYVCAHKRQDARHVLADKKHASLLKYSILVIILMFLSTICTDGKRDVIGIIYTY